jgi:hypothetical protein
MVSWARLCPVEARHTSVIGWTNQKRLRYMKLWVYSDQILSFTDSDASKKETGCGKQPVKGP